MTTYVIVGAIVGLVIGWAWFAFLFPKAREEFSGTAEGWGASQLALVTIALLLFALALGTFLKNRNVLGLADAVRVGFKVWFGFLLPAIAVLWSAVRKPVSALIAVAGYWLVTALALAVLADWMIL